MIMYVCATIFFSPFRICFVWSAHFSDGAAAAFPEGGAELQPGGRRAHWTPPTLEWEKIQIQIQTQIQIQGGEPAGLHQH